MIASGSMDETVRVWDAVTGEPALGGPLEGHGDAVVSVAWSPDGTMIASGSDDKTVRVWDSATGEPALGGPLEGHSGRVLSVAWSPDGTTIVSKDFNEQVLVWNAATGEQVPSDPALPQPTQQGVLSAMPLECRGAVVPVPTAGGVAGGTSEGIAFTCDTGARKATWMSVAPTKRNNAGQPHSAVACLILDQKAVVVLHLIGEDGDGDGEGKEGGATQGVGGGSVRRPVRRPLLALPALVPRKKGKIRKAVAVVIAMVEARMVMVAVVVLAMVVMAAMVGKT
jgi:hypothetical protein